MLKKLPNLLTWLRIAMVPSIIAVYSLPRWGGLLAAALFACAALLDLLDGFFARRYNADSEFGRFIDPVADKLLVVAALLLILGAPAPPVARWIMVAAALLIILREIAVSSLRAWTGAAGNSGALAVSRLAKHKTAVQMVAITMLLAATSFPGWPLGGIGATLLLGGGLLGLLSLYGYLKQAAASGWQK